jgi:hypothetical protein
MRFLEVLSMSVLEFLTNGEIIFGGICILIIILFAEKT